MIDLTYQFEAELWLWAARSSSWCFVTLPVEAADEIKFFVSNRNGFGSVRVDVQIGESKWQTSIFPDKASNSFVLPIKKSVRNAENLTAGDTASLTVHVRYYPE